MKGDYWFDTKAADLACWFFENRLRHVEGEWAGRPFVLLDWQRDLVSRLFGWKRRDGTRKYRRCYVEIPRKQGKTTLAAGIALYLLFADDEPGAQVYSAAGDREQASLVFHAAKAMVEQSPPLLSLAELRHNSIVVPRMRSVYKAISAESYTKHGLSASGVIFDEVHVQPDRTLWDTLATSTGARRQPLIFAITTAGYDRNSLCWELHEHARQVRDQIIDDPTFLPVLYSADESDDWADPATWKKANPSLGATVSEDFLADECRLAQQTPAYEATFRRLYLCQWTRQETRWLPMQKWDACRTDIDPDELVGRQCYGGLDLSTTTDLSAFALVFPDDEGGLDCLVWYWMPGDSMIERERRDRVPYGLWQRQGLIEATPGNVIDYEAIQTTISDLADRYDIQNIAYDPWNATSLVLRLQEQGMTMIPIRQGFASLSAPTKALEGLVLGGKLRHNGSPVLRWNVDSATVASDPAGNIKLVKPARDKSGNRIDGLAALVNAIDRATRAEKEVSVYEERDMILL